MTNATATATKTKYYQLKRTRNGFHYLTTKKPAYKECDLSKATKATKFAFDFLNEALFDGKVEPVVITLQSSKGSYGHCTINKIWNDGTNNHGKREINMSLDHLSIDPMHYLGTVIHEICHAFNLQQNILDCNPANQYHNKKFKAQAEAVGLVVTRSDRYGFAHTHVAQNNLEGIAPVAERAISELILKTEWDQTAFEFSRGSGCAFRPTDGQGPTGPRGGKGTPKGKGTGSKLKKWTCSCGINVRVAVADFDATCNQCGNHFELA